MSETLLQEKSQGVLRLTLNRPEALNALTTELLKALLSALKAARKDKAVRCVVLTSAGRGFCSGQDLKEFVGKEIKEISFQAHLKHYIPIIEAIATLEKPAIAAVRGVAAGAGLSLALACDMRLASEDASFTTAFSRIGLVPDSGMSLTLSRLVGYAKAFELLTLSPRVSARDALELGLVNRVFDAESFDAKVGELAREFAQGPSGSYGLIKRALRKSSTADLSEVLSYESYLQEIAGSGPEFAEGYRAFLEKRAPIFARTVEE